MFVIRNQGFFYTDEYYAPGNVFRQVAKKAFKKKFAADKECAAVVRAWIRKERLGDYVFDDGDAIERIVSYFRTTWPDDDTTWDHELAIPSSATDPQVDEIVKRMGVTFAKVFEVDDEDDDDDDDGDELDEDLNFGPRD